MEEELKESLVNGRLAWAMAFKIIGKHGASTKKVGDLANRLNVEISSASRAASRSVANTANH